MKSIFFCVQGVPNRPEWELTKQCIEASDIGQEYTLYLQRSDETPHEYFYRVLQGMYDSGCDLCVRFEDDLSGVNRHIKHNLRTWPSLRDRKFGVGWLMAPGGIRGVRDRWHRGILHMSQGNLLKREDIPSVIEHAKVFWTDRNDMTFDLALSYAAQQMGRQVCVHNPSLVQHNESGASVIGNTHHPVHDSDCGSFKLDWRRRA